MDYSKNMDVIVIGGGPAGLAAACSARSCGLDVLLVDDQPYLGGQLFRNIENTAVTLPITVEELAQGRALIDRFRNSGAGYLPSTTVWEIEGERISCMKGEEAMVLHASYIIVAAGAMERPVPFPGWTLPGVMGAGAADILLRSGGTFSPDKESPVVLAGNGPLLLSLASHLIECGIPIAAWLDTGAWKNRLAGALLAPAGLLDASYLKEGLKKALTILRHKVKIVRNVSEIKAEGKDSLECICYSDGKNSHSIAAKFLLYHEGVIPRTHIFQALDAAMKWDPVQRYWHPVTDLNGKTSIGNVYCAGDGGFINGGLASICKGALAGIDVARRLGVIESKEADYRSKDSVKKLRLLSISRCYIRYLFAPNPAIYRVPDDTVVCRCECVTAGDIRQAVSEHFLDVNEIKRVTRCGMGPCQGRMCGPALAEIASAAQAKNADFAGQLHVRFPLRPITLEQYCRINK